MESTTPTADCSPMHWSVADVEAWARVHQLPEEVIASLTSNQVDGKTLVTLTKEDLRTELQIDALGTRRDLWTLIQKLCSDLNHGDREKLGLNQALVVSKSSATLPSHSEHDVAESKASEETQPVEKARPKLRLIETCHFCYSFWLTGFALKCGHASCTSCLKALCKRALTDTSLLPLKCCERPFDPALPSTVLKKDDVEVLRIRTQDIVSGKMMNSSSSWMTYDLLKCGTSLCGSVRPMNAPG